MIAATPPQIDISPVRLKVCQIVAEPYRKGGLEKHFIELCRGISEHCELHIIAHESYRRFFSESISFHSANLGHSRNNPFLLFKIARLIQNIRPDIVHSHAKKAGQLIGSIGPFIKPKIVVTIHNQTKVKWWMYRYTKIICVSKTIRKSLPNLPTKTIYNGIKFRQPSFEYILPADRFNIVSVGTLAPRKGFKTLIEACSPLPVNLHIVGDGPEMGDLYRLREQSEGKAEIFLYGYRDDAINILAASDLTVIASSHEGFFYVFSESMSVETPTISTNVPVACEFLKEKYLVPINDHMALRRKIAYCVKNAAKVRRDFSNVFLLSKEKFTFDRMISQTASTYQELQITAASVVRCE